MDWSSSWDGEPEDRITAGPDEILGYLRDRVGLVADDTPYLVAVQATEALSWTRDPFDRLIVGSASAAPHPLLTKDRAILKHYQHALWSDYEPGSPAARRSARKRSLI